jgi:hypothetical protein
VQVQNCSGTEALEYFIRGYNVKLKDFEKGK